MENPMTDTADLIKRLEKAMGPDRGIDGMIARDILGWLPNFGLEGNRILEWHEYGGHWHLPGDPCDHLHNVDLIRNPEPPLYTASIDAALMLVPANWYADISARADGPTCVLQEFPKPCRRVPDSPYVIRTGIVPESQKDIITAAALCICIAAIKARVTRGQTS